MPASTKAKLKRTISRLAYAMITSTDPETGVDTYGTIKNLPHIAGGREYSIEPVGDKIGIYADGLEVYSEDENEGYDITLTTVAVTDDVEADWYGNTVTTDGVVEFADTGKFPEFALFIYEDTTDGVGQITFFGKCHINQRRSDAGKTKEEGTIEPQFPEHNIACRPRWNDRFVKKTIKGKTLLENVPTITKPSTAAMSLYDEDDG